jgi:VWFA-related protein
MKPIALFCLLVSILYLPGAAAAQQPAQTLPAASPAIAGKAQAPEVLLPVAVVDKHGALVTNLTAQDFTLSEDGRPQKITSLAAQSPQPFWLGLVVDTGRQMSAALDSERKAAAKFGDQMLGGDDKSVAKGSQIFLIHFDREVELLTDDFTSSATSLRHEIDAMNTTSRGRNDQGPESGDNDDRHGGNGAPSRGGRMGGGAQLYDAIWLSAGEMKLAKGARRAIVVYSDGVDRGSKETLNDAIDEAERNGVQVFTIYLKGEEERQNNLPGSGRHGGMGGGWPGGGSGGGYPGGGSSGGGRGGSKGSEVDGKGILQKIAQRTGGQFFEAKKKDNLDEIYGLIANALRQQYLLVYTPDQADPNGEYHKIVLKTSKSDLTVITREGYYAKSGAQ